MASINLNALLAVAGGLALATAPTAASATCAPRGGYGCSAHSCAAKPKKKAKKAKAGCCAATCAAACGAKCAPKCGAKCGAACAPKCAPSA
jgi:hypothetical protein